MARLAGKDIASLIFYAWGEPLHMLLMLFTTLYTWFLCLQMEKARERGKKGLEKFLLILCLIFSLGSLFYFKYFTFLTENLPFLQGLGLPQPALPIGISFYTFQALSYVLDVYWGKVKAQKNWLNFAMYISLFPQLVAGPIVRYEDIESQLTHRKLTAQGLYEGTIRFVIGLGKKVLLANQIGLLYDKISAGGSLSVVSAWLSAIAFTFQIYFDFSGYSDMAIGMGRMFGFDFPENFRYPYESKSVSEFWRRWHVTLGTWFREYVYIPLGGNRRSTPRVILNLFIVWALTGLWHGAAWNFVLWGVYYFVFLVLEKFVLGKWMKKWPAFLQHLYTLLVVVFGWVLFASPSLADAVRTWGAMLGIGVPFLDGPAKFYFMGSLALIPILILASTHYPKNWTQRLQKSRHPAACRWASWVCVSVLLLCSLSFLVGDSYNPFLYFRF